MADVAVAEVSQMASVQKARGEYEERKNLRSISDNQTER